MCYVPSYLDKFVYIIYFDVGVNQSTTYLYVYFKIPAKGMFSI